MMKTATSIETKLWYDIIESLKTSGWLMTSEYELFDKGIDFDFYELRKGSDRIFLTWDNWFEGEIECSAVLMVKIEKEFNVNFRLGNQRIHRPILRTTQDHDSQKSK